MRVALRCRMEVGILDASRAGKRRWDNLERAFLDRRLPGADYLTVNHDDWPEHAAAAGQLFVLGRNDCVAVSIGDRILVERREQVNGRRIQGLVASGRPREVPDAVNLEAVDLSAGRFDAHPHIAERQPRPPGEVLHCRRAVTREVALRQRGERLIAIEQSGGRYPLVEQRERRLLALVASVADQAGLRVVGQDVQSS